MKLYIVPTFADQFDDRHDVLGPYADTPSSLELARKIADRYQHAGVPCKVIRSATPPTKVAQGITCDVLTNGSDYSNGGLSSRVRRVTLLDPRLDEITAQIKARGDFPVRLWEPTDSAPAVHLAETAPGYLVARPSEPRSGDKVIGPMSGGAWIIGTDRTRWEMLTGSPRPIPLHDRYETAEQYRHLST